MYLCMFQVFSVLEIRNKTPPNTFAKSDDSGDVVIKINEDI